METSTNRATRTSPGRPLPRRLRVETMISQLNEGGAERFAIALAEALDPDLFSVGMIVTRQGSWHEEREHLRRHGVDVLEIPRWGKLDVSAWRPALSRLRRADILHAHMHGSNLWASVLGQLARVPTIVATEHSWSFQGAPMRLLADRYVVGTLADSVVAVSEEDRRKLHERVRIPASKLRVVPTGRAPHFGTRDEVSGESLRAALGIPESARIVTTVAYLRHEKALDVLLRAFAECPAATHLVLAGDGELRGSLESEAQRLGVSDRVHFLGVRQDIERILGQSDVFAMSSDTEGSPLALIEAMAAGLGVAATEVGGVPAIAPDGEVALLVPPQQPRLLAEAITKLLVDPDLRARLGEAAARRASEFYSFESVVSQWEALYVDLYQHTRGRWRR